MHLQEGHHIGVCMHIIHAHNIMCLPVKLSTQGSLATIHVVYILSECQLTVFQLSVKWRYQESSRLTLKLGMMKLLYFLHSERRQLSCLP